MADNRRYAQAQKFTIAVGISTTDTSITLQSFNFPDGTAIAAGDLGTINYGTLEPGTSREESISFTGITSNADGTVTLTGVTRGLGFGAVDTYSEQSNLKSQHGTGAIFILSNTAAFYNDFVNKNNDESMAGMLSVQTPTSASHAATKQYVDDTVNGGAVSNDRIVQAATAGESVAAGDLVYFDDTDNEWKKTVGTTAATLNNVLLGIAQGSGSNGGAITGGVLTYGLDSTQTGLTAGVKLYAGDTAGAIVETAGTVERVIGWSKSATEIYFDANVEYTPTASEKDAMAGGDDFGTPSANNKFLTEEGAGSQIQFGDGSDGDVTISSPTTLTRDMYYDNLVVNDTLTTNGFRIFVRDTISGTGTIKYPDGNAGGNGSGQTAGAAGAAFTSGFFVNTAGGNGGAGSGGSGAAGANGSAPATQTSIVNTTVNATGGAGGSAQGAGGAGGGTATLSNFNKFWTDAFQVVKFLDQNLTGAFVKYVSSCGGAGGGGGGGGSLSGEDGGGGGGGGASGGVVFIAAKNWTGTFTIMAIGGNGGNGASDSSSGGNGGGGAGGNGGVSVVVYSLKTWTGSYNLAGGAAGLGSTDSGPAGEDGNAGFTGISFEIPVSNLI